eukprot:6162138-Amphidinium_carterae.1
MAMPWSIGILIEIEKERDVPLILGVLLLTQMILLGSGLSLALLDFTVHQPWRYFSNGNHCFSIRSHNVAPRYKDGLAAAKVTGAE